MNERQAWMASNHEYAGTDTMTTNATYRRIIVPAQIGAAAFGFCLALLVAPPADYPYWGRIIAAIGTILFGIGGMMTALVVSRGTLTRDE